MTENNNISDEILKAKLANVNAMPLMSWSDFYAANSSALPQNSAPKYNRADLFLSTWAVTLVVLTFFLGMRLNSMMPSNGELVLDNLDNKENVAIPHQPSLNSEPEVKQADSFIKEAPSSNDIKLAPVENPESSIDPEEKTPEMLYAEMAGMLDAQKRKNNEKLNSAIDTSAAVGENMRQGDYGHYFSYGKGETVSHDDPDKFMRSLKRSGGVLIDLRSSEEFKSGHIRGAENHEFIVREFPHSISKIKKEKEIFVYCENGEVSESAKAMLWKSGYYTVHILKGGIDNWKKQNLVLIKN